jgi:hypothetical protein
MLVARRRRRLVTWQVTHLDIGKNSTGFLIGQLEHHGDG